MKVKMQEVDEIVGRKIQGRRLESKRSQDWLAEALGVDRSAVSKFERGVTPVNLPLLFKIAYALGRRPGWFIKDLDKMFTESKH